MSVSAKPIELKIRKASAFDTVNLAKFAKKMGKDSEYETMGSIDDTNLVYYCGKLIATGLVVIAEVSGRIVGVLALDRDKEPWSPDHEWFLSLEWFLILEAFRKRGTAEKMLEWLEGFADEQNVPIHFGLYNPDKKTPLLEMFLQRRGFEYMGANFKRMPKVGKEKIDINV